MTWFLFQQQKLVQQYNLSILHIPNPSVYHGYGTLETLLPWFPVLVFFLEIFWLFPISVVYHIFRKALCFWVSLKFTLRDTVFLVVDVIQIFDSSFDGVLLNFRVLLWLLPDWRGALFIFSLQYLALCLKYQIWYFNEFPCLRIWLFVVVLLSPFMALGLKVLWY